MGSTPGCKLEAQWASHGYAKYLAWYDTIESGRAGGGGERRFACFSRPPPLFERVCTRTVFVVRLKRCTAAPEETKSYRTVVRVFLSRGVRASWRLFDRATWCELQNIPPFVCETCFGFRLALVVLLYA